MADSKIPIAYGTVVAPRSGATTKRSNSRRSLVSSSSTRSMSSRSSSSTSSRVALPSKGAVVSVKDNYETLDKKIRHLLRDQGYTPGLVEALAKNKLAFPMAIWVVDNSGSMMMNDGHRLVETTRKNQVRGVPCTRWAEMQQTVEYHAQLAACLEAPTVFRLLNDPGRGAGPQQFSIAAEHQRKTPQLLQQDLTTALQTMRQAHPIGVTPLVRQLHEIRHHLKQLEPQLRARGTKVVLVLATDGIPTNDRGMTDTTVKRQFREALQALEGLPVWVVIRLCTDEDEVVQYWNSLDAQLEVNLEVLDDFLAEAAEVHYHNKWLNYGLPLHRMREMGFHSRLFDLLDERRLLQDELYEFCHILFGTTAMDGVPDPHSDWKGFCERVGLMAQREEKTWNPVTKRMEPWINVPRMEWEYGAGLLLDNCFFCR